MIQRRNEEKDFLIQQSEREMLLFSYTSIFNPVKFYFGNIFINLNDEIIEFVHSLSGFCFILRSSAKLDKESFRIAMRHLSSNERLLEYRPICLGGIGRSLPDGLKNEVILNFPDSEKLFSQIFTIIV